jgi:hypothetical protein
VTLNHAPAIRIVKSAFPGTYGAADVPITYTYVVQDTGNAGLTGVMVIDNTVPGGAVCGPFALAAGEDHTCTATYRTTSADVTRGFITNQATATGTPPAGGNVSDTTSTTVVFENAPVIAVSKSAIPLSFSAAGQEITYTYTVVNNGDTPLDDVHVTDNLPGLSEISCNGPGQGGQFPIGAEMTCTATYTTTGADLVAGLVFNEAKATGMTPDGTTVLGTAELAIPGARIPEIPGELSITVPDTASLGSTTPGGTVSAARQGDGDRRARRFGGFVDGVGDGDRFHQRPGARPVHHSSDKRNL